MGNNEGNSIIKPTSETVTPKVKCIKLVSLGQETTYFELNLSMSQISVNFSTEKAATPKKKVRHKKQRYKEDKNITLKYSPVLKEVNTLQT